MPFVEALCDKTDDIQILIESPFHKYRPYLDEPNYKRLPIINLFENKLKLTDIIKGFSIGISLGIFHSLRAVIFANYFTRNSNKYFLISETEHGINNNKFKKNIKKLFSLFINKNNFNLLAIGGVDCFNYYCSIGLYPNKSYNFGYFTYKKYISKSIHRKINNKLNLIVVSQLIERKNIQFLLKAINKLNEENQKLIILTIVGDGILKDKLELYSKKIYSKVIFKGSISNNDDVLTLMRNNNFLVLPSLFDGWGAVVNEAISSGLGLLLSDKVYANVELLREGENGFFFNLESINNLSDLLLKLLVDKGKLHEKFSDKSIEISKLWSGEVAADRFLKLLKGERTYNWKEGPLSSNYH